MLPTAPDPSGRQPGLGYIRQIQILAIMTFIQGALLSLMGIVCIAYAFLLANMQAMMPPAERARMQAQSGPMFEVMGWVTGGVGAVVLIIAMLHIVAGYRSLKYRGRIFTMVVWLSGLLASITCYCAPTSIGLVIWGMIVFLNPAVARAFELAEAGETRAQIENKFY